MVSYSHRGTKSICRKAKFNFSQGLCHHGSHCYVELASTWGKLEERVYREKKKPYLKCRFYQITSRPRSRTFTDNVESLECRM